MLKDRIRLFLEDANDDTPKKDKGRDENTKPTEFEDEQLTIGAEVETEHTDDTKEAKAIAQDHINESIYYYQVLKIAEDFMKMLDSIDEDKVDKYLSAFENFVIDMKDYDAEKENIQRETTVRESHSLHSNKGGKFDSLIEQVENNSADTSSSMVESY